MLSIFFIFLRFIGSVAAFLFFSLNNAVAKASCEDIFPVEYTYKVIHMYPHDPDTFSQGLVYSEGYLYESSGLYGHSYFKKVDLVSGNTLKIKHMPKTLFAEGLTLVGNELVLLSYKAEKGFVYDKTSFELLSEFSYSKEGWGLTFDGADLIMSNGSSELVFINVARKKAMRRIKVKDRGNEVVFLNELEFIKGEIYANIWQTEKIARIHPRSGCVLAWINLQGITGYLGPYRNIDVLNGIAYDEKGDRLFVTGKWWPKLFEIKLVQEKHKDPVSSFRTESF